MDKLDTETKAQLADVYEKAAEWIDKHGWFQGWNGHTGGANAACFAIAIQHVRPAYVSLALEFAVDALELEGNPPAAIFNWNDDPDRTKDEVINTLHALANKLR